MRKGRFAGIVCTVILLLLCLCSTVWAKTPRDAAVDYAYQIYNYTWSVKHSIPRYHADKNPTAVSGTIKGIPYTYANMVSFAEYKALSNADKGIVYGGSMKYGMVCATLVTDCIRQAFWDRELPLLHTVMFHKSRYSSAYTKLVSSVSSAIFNNDHTCEQWQNIWASIRSSQASSGYPAYKKLQKGDYLNDWNHVIFVVDNNTSTQTITYIDQTYCWDTVANGMVGTHKGTYTYARLSEKCYVPMYVNYPASFRVYHEPPKILTTSLSDAYIGEFFYAKIQVTGTTPIYFTGGTAKTLANGIGTQEMLNGSDTSGIIKGTPKNPAKRALPYTLNFTVTATNSAGSSAPRTFTITVRQRKPIITTTSPLPQATQGRTYAVTFAASNNPTKWAIISGSLPRGLSLNQSTGKLAGTPAVCGLYTFKVRAYNSAGWSDPKEFKLVVNRPPVIFGTLKDAMQGMYYEGYVGVDYGTLPFKAEIIRGTRPAGLSMSVSGRGVYFKGTPSTIRDYEFTLKITDKNGATATKAFKMKVKKKVVLTFSYSFMNGVNGIPYSDWVKVSGGTSPYTCSIASGKLPDGLYLSVSGERIYIKGTPKKAGTFTFTLKTRDKNGAEGSKAYSITIVQPAITGTVPSLLARGATVSITSLKADWAIKPCTWRISSGRLPDGLSINSSTGKISGTLRKAGRFVFTVTVRDKNGLTVSKSFAMTVTETTVTGTIQTVLTRGVSVVWVFKASGGTPSYIWSLGGGSLPAGLSFNKSTGKVSGGLTKVGTYTFIIKAVDRNGIAGTKKFTVKVVEPTPTDVGATPRGVKSLPSVSGITLQIDSRDIVEAHEGRDSDIVKVKAGAPVRFIVGGRGFNASDVRVFIDDALAEDITVEEGTFTLPAEKVHGDFKVGVRAQHGDEELESEELYIISER
ncbi:MAG: putative Ig domain-containing protein [Synergistaceae bacterium]|nr:putative Ig domain-containing protein [Synergistaceae bacterium]